MASHGRGCGVNELQRKITVWASALEREFKHSLKCLAIWQADRENREGWLLIQNHQDLRQRRAAEIRALASEAPRDAAAVLFRAATMLEATADNAANLLAEAASLAVFHDEDLEQFVTLQQMAAIVGKSKRTLQRLYESGDLPAADIPGGKGMANEWRWSVVRPILEEKYNRKLPQVFPADRIIRES